jgi:hypothetical protein
MLTTLMARTVMPIQLSSFPEEPDCVLYICFSGKTCSFVFCG